VNERSILLVEDDLDDVELTKRAFARSPFSNEVEVARDGSAAIDRLLGLDAGPMPALVLLDLKLPRVDGLEVLGRLRADDRTRSSRPIDWGPTVTSANPSTSRRSRRRSTRSARIGWS
jgi:two-component system response regulator